MTYERAAMLGVGLALAVTAAPYFDGEPSPEQEPGNTWGAPTEQVSSENVYVVPTDDQEGLWGVADGCTATDPELVIVWKSLVNVYGESFRTHVGQAVEVPNVDGVAVDCATN